MDLDLDGKRTIVLAASQGLGLAAATELAREGARVVITSRDEDNLKAAKGAILDETDGPASSISAITCDHSAPASVPPTIEEAIGDLGGLDIMVTNSGSPPKIGFDTAAVDDFRRAYTLILESVIAAIDTALPSLLDSTGVLTHVIAATAQEPEANHVVANTIRLGIYGLSKSLSREYASEGLRSNCVCPRKVGPKPGGEGVTSPHIEAYAADHGLDYDDAAGAYVEEVIPLGRRGSLAEFGKIVAILSSPVAGFVTGQTIDIDGGWTRHVF